MERGAKKTSASMEVREKGMHLIHSTNFSNGEGETKYF